MIRICPSILNADFSNLALEIERVAEVSDLLHLDIMDGKFVPNETFTIQESKKIIAESALKTDVHLMIADADNAVIPYLETTAISLTVHLEALAKPLETLRNIRSHGKRAGLAIKPGTPIDSIHPFLMELDMILIMTVEPGFGGQKFMAEMMPKVATARKWLDANNLDDTWLQVDGGVNLETIKIARNSGADTFVAGSVVYKSVNPAEIVKALRVNATAE
ncbi:MAG: ribulose-phosphate 3-epimerase [Actinomycetales bacterium]